MGDLEVYIECDHRDCRARSRDIWTKGEGAYLLAFCGHHGDALLGQLIAQGFEPLEHNPATDDCDSEVAKA